MQYARGGTLEVALNEHEAARLRDMQAWLGERHVECEWVAAEDLARVEPAVTSNAVGGLLIPGQGFVAVGALVHALVQAARFSGAVFETPVEAVRVESSADHVEVRAGDTRYEADAVVVAVGTWSGRVKIVGAPPLPVRPVRGQLLQLSWTGPTLPRRPVWGARAYTVPWQPDALLVGATVEEVGFDERSTVAGIRDLLDGVAELLPGASGSVARGRPRRPASRHTGRLAASSVRFPTCRASAWPRATIVTASCSRRSPPTSSRAICSTANRSGARRHRPRAIRGPTT